MSAQPRSSSRSAVSDYGSSRHKPSGSVSSNMSHSRSDAEGRREPSGTARSSQTKRVETSVTRLLVSIKHLLEGLTDWSNHQVSDQQISDMYVRFGNDFNATVVAFDGFSIDMGELKRVPEDLRDVLERCLAEDASPENLSLYLPGVRKIITYLLEGLRKKQDEYRLREPGYTRSRRSSKTELPYADEPSKADDTPTQGVRSTSSRSSRATTPTPGDSMRARRPADPRRGPSASDSERRTPSVSKGSGGVPVPPVPQGDGPRSGQLLPRSPSQKRAQISRSASATPAPPDTDPESVSSRSKASPRITRQAASIPTPSASPTQNGETSQASRSDSIRAVAPPEMPRYSLQDPPVGTSFSMEVTSPATPNESPVPEQPRSATPDSSTPAVESSLAALKQSEALQRRASKRFSSYTMSKMAGSAMGSSPSVAGNLRRSVAAGAMLTAGDLAALTEADEGTEEPSSTPQPRHREIGRKRSIERRARTPTLDEAIRPPVPSIPNDSEDQPKTTVNGVSHIPVLSTPASSKEQRLESPKDITVYFQVGRQVKKVTTEPPSSFAALRVLFMNKFLYNPGQDNFPEIYIRDPSSGVQYELEDVAEVKDKCLLSLNIEPLDQIKQHIDTQIATLSQEIKDLKSTVASQKRMSLTAPPVSPGFSNGPVLSRPTENQFQSMARRIGKAQARNATVVAPLAPQLTGTSDVGSVTSSRIVTDLKTQFDEVQNIRRDLGVMRQIYVDFTNSTKESLNALRQQATNVRQVANTKVGGARASINTGKARLDKRSQGVLTEIEDLQDTVENLKDDVLKRHVTPRIDVLKKLRSKIDTTTKELDDLKDHISTIKPSWKKTWEQELQNIVEEQQFLEHQEELIEDLIEDHKALAEVFGHVEKVISIRGSGGVRSRSFRPPPPEEGHNGLSTVMLEIRGARVDPGKRMEAIERNQAARRKELQSRSDEFTAELKGFVDGKKLKKTGGAEEVERVRQRKDGLAFKAMFAASGTIGGGMMGANTSTSDSSFGMSSFSGGLPGLAQAPALSDSEDEGSQGDPTA